VATEAVTFGLGILSQLQSRESSRRT